MRCNEIIISNKIQTANYILLIPLLEYHGIYFDGYRLYPGTHSEFHYIVMDNRNDFERNELIFKYGLLRN